MTEEPRAVCAYCGGVVFDTSPVHEQQVCEPCLDQQVEDALQRAYARYQSKQSV